MARVLERSQFTIHNSQILLKVDKFKYFQSQLTGKATDSLAGLDITNEYYDITVEMLKERYRNLDTIINAHYSKLKNISQLNYKATTFWAIYVEVEKHRQTLKSLAQDVKQRQILIKLQLQLSLSVLEKLEQQKEKHKNIRYGLWTALEKNCIAMRIWKKRSDISWGYFKIRPKKHLNTTILKTNKFLALLRTDILIK